MGIKTQISLSLAAVATAITLGHASVSHAEMDGDYPEYSSAMAPGSDDIYSDLALEVRQPEARRPGGGWGGGPGFGGPGFGGPGRGGGHGGGWGGGGPGWGGGGMRDQTITCSSEAGRDASCGTSLRNIQIIGVRQISKYSPCISNQTYWASGSTIYVVKGCRAVFTIRGY